MAGNIMNEEIQEVIDDTLNLYNSEKDTLLRFMFALNQKVDAFAALTDTGYTIEITQGLTSKIYDFIFKDDYLDKAINDLIQTYLPEEEINHIKHMICVTGILCIFFHEYGHVVQLHHKRLNINKLSEFANVDCSTAETAIYQPNLTTLMECEADMFMGMMMGNLLTKRLEAIGIENNRNIIEEKIMILSVFTLFYVLNNSEQDNDYPPLIWRVYSSVATALHTQKEINKSGIFTETDKVINIADFTTPQRADYFYSLFHDEDSQTKENFMINSNRNFDIWQQFYEENTEVTN